MNNQKCYGIGAAEFVNFLLLLYIFTVTRAKN